MKLEFSRQIFEECSNIKFQKKKRIRPVGAELFMRTDGNKQSKRLLFTILRTRLKSIQQFLNASFTGLVHFDVG